MLSTTGTGTARALVARAAVVLLVAAGAFGCEKSSPNKEIKEPTPEERKKIDDEMQRLTKGKK